MRKRVIIAVSVVIVCILAGGGYAAYKSKSQPRFSPGSIESAEQIPSTQNYCVGDVNGDGVVDQKDLDLVKASLGEVVGTDGYNRMADVDNSGVINDQDTAVVSKHMGCKGDKFTY